MLGRCVSADPAALFAAFDAFGKFAQAVEHRVEILDLIGEIQRQVGGLLDLVLHGVECLVAGRKPRSVGGSASNEVNESVKVVSVDGIAAGQPEYKIKAGQ